MPFRSKEYLKSVEKMQQSSVPQSLLESLSLVVSLSKEKFDASVSLDFILGIDASKGDQVVRGSSLLPHGTGKKVRVAAFVKADHEQAARDAGADFVGLEDLIAKVESGWMDFDVAVATPDVMVALSKVARVLGPKGLLPNKKVGTVTFDVASVVADLKKGRVSFKNDKAGGLHVAIGKVSFGAEKLEENARALLKSLVSCRPASSKGKFVRKIVVSSTQGLGVVVPVESLALC